MRFYRKLKPQIGDRRVRRGLVICKTIGTETRFLEFTTWTEELQKPGGRVASLPNSHWQWVPVAWGDQRRAGA